jgi:hypothetical protein
MENEKKRQLDWFEILMGFKEESPEQVRENIQIEGETITSLINHQSYHFGTLEIASLKEIKKKLKSLKEYKNQLSVNELVGNIKDFHVSIKNKNAVFQAASQFNLLEMAHPHLSPERGVGIYERDYTQGPACAITCGAGTIYRNYFIELNGQIGQSSSNQIDCLMGIGNQLKNRNAELWQMTNGYALSSKEGLIHINRLLYKFNSDEIETLKEELRVGIQWNTEVTLSTDKHRVNQVYCSALPVAYSHIDSVLWANFAQLILEATYEATLYVALMNYEQTGNNNVFLTLVGGGAFGNDEDWISAAILNSITKFKNTPLNINIVSYGESNLMVRNLIDTYNAIIKS